MFLAHLLLSATTATLFVAAGKIDAGLAATLAADGITLAPYAEAAAALAAPDVREKLMNQGVVPVTSTPEQFAATVRADYAKYAKLIKVANIKLE